MYVVEHYFYEKGSNGNLIEKDGDYYFKGSNDYEEARKMFDECIQYFSNQLVVIMLTKASSVYAGNLEYDMIDSYSTLKSGNTVFSMPKICRIFEQKGLK